MASHNSQIMITPNELHYYYMGLALEEAKKAFAADEVPIGAIIVHQNNVIGRGYNQRETLQSPIAHAEILAIQEASQTLKSWRLLEADLYVTMEPCSMCAGALVLARIRSIHFGVSDPKGGACGSVFDIVQEPLLNHLIEVNSGLRAEDSRALIQEFFRSKRRLKKEEKARKKEENYREKL